MGALAHHIEAEGVATTSISMVREHTQRIRPPRALWVPFEFGRPLGVPDDREFQRAVVRAALSLTERDHGPVLEDYPVEAPSTVGGEEGWACPVALPSPQADESEPEQLARRVLDEVARLRPWWLEAYRRRGRTAFGLSGLTPDDVDTAAEVLARFAAGATVEAPAQAKVPLPRLLRFLANDVKSFYLEAATAQPGQRAASGDELARWLYTKTTLGGVLYRVRGRLAVSEDPGERRAQGGIVPGVFVRLSD